MKQQHGREKWRGETWKRNKKPKPTFLPRRKPKLRKMVSESSRAAAAAETIKATDLDLRKKARRDRSQTIAQRNLNSLQTMQAKRKQDNSEYYQNGTAWQQPRARK